MTCRRTYGNCLKPFPALVFLSLLPVLFWAHSCKPAPAAPEADKRPNILLLVADDLGYADIGCYGGDMATPNLDALAARGIRFSRFHTAPMCAPTRAMLLSGNYNHIAGMGRQNLRAPVFGYEGELSDRIVPLPALLRAGGYHTYMAGKWHLGESTEANPHAKGFEHSFVLLEGVGNHYSSRGIFKSPASSHYTEDGQEASWPEGRYSTDLYTDKLIGYIARHQADKKPFFAYAAYTSPHWPLQVDSSYWKKYQGRYDRGYEVLREERLRHLKEAGMVPTDAVLPPLHPLVKPWATLSAEEQQREARKMELYAGMVDNLDENIGRLLDYLEQNGLLENTLVVFMSDNGAAGEDYFNEDELRPYLNEVYSNDYPNMGTERSMVSYGPAWAEAGTAPFRYYKEYTTNGGMIAPMILSGPGVERQNEIYDGMVSVMDLAPSFYELAGVQYPQEWEGHMVFPMKGSSILPYAGARTPAVHPAEYGFGMEHTAFTMYRKGDWKINNLVRPFKEENFELFNLSDDLSEQHDLRAVEPEKYREVFEAWRQYAIENQLQLPR